MQNVFLVEQFLNFNTLRFDALSEVVSVLAFRINKTNLHFLNLAMLSDESLGPFLCLSILGLYCIFFAYTCV